jgi:hypothetical protein
VIRLLVAAAVLLGAATAAGSDQAVPHSDAGRYAAPIAPLVVVRGFDPPVTPYGPGHLGVDLAAAPDEAVHAAGGAVVRFAGPVAGRGVVVLLHPDGVSTEYEPLRVSVSAGAIVQTRRRARLRARHARQLPAGSVPALGRAPRRGVLRSAGAAAPTRAGAAAAMERLTLQ